MTDCYFTTPSRSGSGSDLSANSGMTLLRRLRAGLLGVALVAGLAACGDKNDGPSGAAGGKVEYSILDDDQIVGDRNAPVVIIEYFSFTCPHCAEFHEGAFPYMKEKYLDTGKAVYVMRPYFWDNAAANAAMLTHCAPERIRNKMTDTILASQRTWMFDPQGQIEGLVKIAKQAMISREDFAACTSDPKVQAWAQSHLDQAEAYGINSTPTFIVNGEIVFIRSIDDLDRIMAKFSAAEAPVVDGTDAADITDAAEPSEAVDSSEASDTTGSSDSSEPEADDTVEVNEPEANEPGEAVEDTEPQDPAGE